ncbi:unnamed protein product [Cylicocyclus nassatus]|uniref:Uncharacterized protein n=1 Tax=Cylicocyclus nassatus TaxID=53992 RepID=A0AA36HD93_CYLNA|nr:unnamed protein product [Cylicocyclus nassatus]
MPLCVAASTVGAANGIIMTSSRLFYVGAREGQMPVVLTMINKRLRTPIPAVIFTCLVSIGYLFISSNLYVLINASQVTAWLAITVVVIALLRLRCKYPYAERTVKEGVTRISDEEKGTNCELRNSSITMIGRSYHSPGWAGDVG